MRADGAVVRGLGLLSDGASRRRRVGAGLARHKQPAPLLPVPPRPPPPRSSANGLHNKQYNWSTLNHKVFRALGITFSRQQLKDVATAVPGGAETILSVLHAKLEQAPGKENGGGDAAVGKLGFAPAPAQQPAAPVTHTPIHGRQVDEGRTGPAPDGDAAPQQPSASHLKQENEVGRGGDSGGGWSCSGKRGCWCPILQGGAGFGRHPARTLFLAR